MNGLDLTTIRAALLKRAQTRRWLATGQIMTGILTTLAIPALLAGLLAAGIDRFGHMHHSDIGWMEGFVLMFVILMPAAYFMEWRTQGGYLTQRLNEIESSDGGWYEAITRDRTWRWNARAGAAEWEICLFAPRMVFGGFAKLRGMRMVGVADTMRAAEVLAALLARDHGIEIDALRRPNEDALTLSRVMSYLLFYEWLGASETGQKAWALSETREELAALK